MTTISVVKLIEYNLNIRMTPFGTLTNIVTLRGSAKCEPRLLNRPNVSAITAIKSQIIK